MRILGTLEATDVSATTVALLGERIPEALHAGCLLPRITVTSRI